MAFTLYTYFLSSASYRVRIALNHKGLDYDSVGVHLRRKDHRVDEYRKVNPQGLVPALSHDGTAIPQSLAIIDYLEEIHPEPRLLPPAPQERALVRSMAQLIACEMHPLCNLRVLLYLREQLGHDEAAVKQWYHHWIAEGMASLEAMVVRYTEDGEHCFGSTVTMADVCLVPQMFNARRFECDLSPYPGLVKVDAALARLAAFSDAAPANQPDAENQRNETPKERRKRVRRGLGGLKS